MPDRKNARPSHHVCCLLCKDEFLSVPGFVIHLGQFHNLAGKRSKDNKRYYSKHKEKIRLRRLRYIEAHKDRLKIRAKARIDRARSEMIEAYGGRCTCCGETTKEFLQLDHIYNDGALERKGFGTIKKMTGWQFYFYLRRIGFPKDRYQLLCANCNAGKHLCGGVCPHKRV